VGQKLQVAKNRIDDAVRRRAVRVNALVVCRILLVAAGVYAGYLLRHDLNTAGRWVTEDGHGPDWLTKPVNTATSLVETALEQLGVHQVDLAPPVFGGMIAVIIAVAGYGIVLVSWRWWERQDLTDFFRQQDTRHGPSAALIFALLVLLIAAGTMVSGWVLG
jgi:hypothetical protein